MTMRIKAENADLSACQAQPDPYEEEKFLLTPEGDEYAKSTFGPKASGGGLILLKNGNIALPFDTSAGKVKVNVFGTASCMNYGGSGSGAANTVTFTQGLQEAGFDTNEDLYNLYSSSNKDGSFSFQAASQISTAGGGYSAGSNNDNNFEVPHYTSETTSAGKTALQSAVDWSDIAIVAFGRAGMRPPDTTWAKWHPPRAIIPVWQGGTRPPWTSTAPPWAAGTTHTSRRTALCPRSTALGPRSADGGAPQ